MFVVSTLQLYSSSRLLDDTVDSVPRGADGRLRSPSKPSSPMRSPSSRPAKRKADSTAAEVPPTAQALAKVRLVCFPIALVKSLYHHFRVRQAFATFSGSSLWVCPDNLCVFRPPCRRTRAFSKNSKATPAPLPKRSPSPRACPRRVVRLRSVRPSKATVLVVQLGRGVSQVW